MRAFYISQFKLMVEKGENDEGLLDGDFKTVTMETDSHRFTPDASFNKKITIHCTYTRVQFNHTKSPPSICQVLFLLNLKK